MVRCETRPFGETFYLKTKEINYQDRLGTNVDKVEARRGCLLLLFSPACRHIAANVDLPGGIRHR